MSIRESGLAEFHVEPADYSADFAALREVRETVFVVEQQVPLDQEWDDLDASCRHVLARDRDGNPIGAARLTPERRIGRMAVLKPWRGRGVGAAMLQTLLDQARERGWPEVSLHAQVSAIGFYQKFGFALTGEPFWEAGIEHRTMRRTLEPFDAVPRAPSDLPPPEPLHPVEDLAQARVALLRILPLARSEIRIYTRDLDPALLGDPDLLDALRQFVAGRRGAQVRILVQEPIRAQQQHHPLLALAQRLQSGFAFRTPIEPEDAKYASAFVVSDRGGVYFRQLGSRFEGEASAGAAARARQLAALFDPVWERSRPCSEFRTLLG